MQNSLNILMAQINPTVGDIENNCKKIIDMISTQQASHDLIVFPELALTGYPPEDLLFCQAFHQSVNVHLKKIQKEIKNSFVLIGHPTFNGETCFNSVSILHNGHVEKIYHKQKLPNYEVFDEARYFIPGPQNPCVIEIKNERVGVCICEDLWQAGPVHDLLENNISVFVSMNASPFDYDKYDRRETLLKSYAKQGVSVVYVNQVCGQDELLFDGQSIALDKTGVVRARAKAFEEELCSVQIHQGIVSGSVAPLFSKEELMYKALVYGTREYVQKNQFDGVLLGLSGGVDSALTLCIAVDALGADNVHAVLMPSRFSAAISLDDAMEQIKALQVSHSVLSIEPAFKSILDTLEPHFQNTAFDVTEENIQARIRGLLLMALSNKTGKMVLTTSNKSETAVGYATLYGDMAGGLAVLKDVLKTQVYALAKYRNALEKVIPERVFTRAPSAELRPNQTDQDSLPDYSTLDAILKHVMEDHFTLDELVQQGFSAVEVSKILDLIQRSEYKRRQSAPGIKISPVAFGKDWRYPLTNGFKGCA